MVIAAGVYLRQRSGEEPARAEPVEPSIAVMPFANLNTEEDSEFLSDGMTDELITALGQVPGLRVVGRGSVFRYKGAEYDPREVGDELRVDAILEGSVQRSGDRLRISARLIDTADGLQLWSERFDQQMRDVFDIQDEISRAIVDELKIELAVAGRPPLVQPATENMEAYQLYLKGVYHQYKLTPAANDRAIEYFEQAKLQDPDYARPYAGLSTAYSQRFSIGIGPPRELLPKAKAEAMRALEIDDTLAEAHAALGSVHVYEWDWPGAESAFKRAIQLNPGDASIRVYYARFLIFVGRTDEAIAELQRALELDPVWYLIYRNLALAYKVRREYDRALEQAHKAVELDPNWWVGYVEILDVHLIRGNYQEALAVAKRMDDTAIAMAYVAAGQRREAIETLNSLKELRRRSYVPAGRIASIYRALGDHDQALDWLETACEERDLTAELVVNPLWDPLRPDPRFQDVLKRMGLRQ